MEVAKLTQIIDNKGGGRLNLATYQRGLARRKVRITRPRRTWVLTRTVRTLGMVIQALLMRLRRIMDFSCKCEGKASLSPGSNARRLTGVLPEIYRRMATTTHRKLYDFTLNFGIRNIVYNLAHSETIWRGYSHAGSHTTIHFKI